MCFVSELVISRWAGVSQYRNDTTNGLRIVEKKYRIAPYSAHAVYVPTLLSHRWIVSAGYRSTRRIRLLCSFVGPLP